jgi:membrane protein implicated in regulation of membrane protease activity
MSRTLVAVLLMVFGGVIALSAMGALFSTAASPLISVLAVVLLIAKHVTNRKASTTLVRPGDKQRHQQPSGTARLVPPVTELRFHIPVSDAALSALGVSIRDRMRSKRYCLD